MVLFFKLKLLILFKGTPLRPSVSQTVHGIPGPGLSRSVLYSWILSIKLHVLWLISINAYWSNLSTLLTAKYIASLDVRSPEVEEDTGPTAVEGRVGQSRKISVEPSKSTNKCISHVKPTFLSLKHHSLFYSCNI